MFFLISWYLVDVGIWISFFFFRFFFNLKILVKEGQEIKAGQVISEAGGDHANNRRLYFEIRKDGKPVDPRYYLPKR